LGSSFKPDFRKLYVGRAHFRGVRFTRPSETIFGHCLIVGGRFHDKNVPFQLNFAADFAGVVCISRDSRKIIHSFFDCPLDGLSTAAGCGVCAVQQIWLVDFRIGLKTDMAV
jgi:hypothetical protein